MDVRNKLPTVAKWAIGVAVFTILDTTFATPFVDHYYGAVLNGDRLAGLLGSFVGALIATVFVTGLYYRSQRYAYALAVYAATEVLFSFSFSAADLATGAPIWHVAFYGTIAVTAFLSARQFKAAKKAELAEYREAA